MFSRGEKSSVRNLGSSERSTKKKKKCAFCLHRQKFCEENVLWKSFSIYPLQSFWFLGQRHDVHHFLLFINRNTIAKQRKSLSLLHNMTKMTFENWEDNSSKFFIWDLLLHEIHHIQIVVGSMMADWRIAPVHSTRIVQGDGERKYLKLFSGHPEKTDPGKEIFWYIIYTFSRPSRIMERT